MPEISIIVPVYKAEQYLPQCIESILAQTFTDFELILVDDGSPDDCGAICDEYAKKDARIKVIHQPNSGVSVARNAALDIARGKYIMFCDSDDWVEPEWCECLYNAIQTPNVVMAVCGHKLWKDDQLEKICQFDESRASIKLSEIFGNSLSGVPWNKIFLSNQINKYSIRFPVGISLSEDLRFILNYLATFNANNEVCFLTRTLNNYRFVDGSLSRKYIRDFWKLEKEVLELRIEVARICNTDFDKYQEQLYYYYYRLFYFSICNLFNSNNKSSCSQKYKELKEIVRSEEFKHMQNSKSFEMYPLWYKWLLKKRVLPFLYIYHMLKRG